MVTIAKSYSVALVEEHCQCHFAIGGFWLHDDMRDFLDQLDQACLPLVKARKPIYVLGDFTDFVAQDRETGDAIRDQLINAQKFGLRRVAIVGASSLVKLQYKRLSAGIEVEFFDSQSEAAMWLRACEQTQSG